MVEMGRVGRVVQVAYMSTLSGVSGRTVTRSALERFAARLARKGSADVCPTAIGPEHDRPVRENLVPGTSRTTSPILQTAVGV